MTATTPRQRVKDNSNSAGQRLAESPKEITQDFVEYLADYARKKPGYAALWCIGVGFVLGWKLKPW